MKNRIFIGLVLLCACTYLTAQTTIERQVSHTLDDANEKDDGKVETDKDKHELGEDRTLGYRFQDMFIPPGATINSAYLELVSEKDEDKNPSSVIISGELNSYPAPFSETDFGISSRATSLASVSWTFGDWSKDATYASPDLSAVIQEIIDIPGWASGSSLVLVLESTGSEKRKAYTSDESAAVAAKLVIEYTGGLATDIADHLANDLDLDPTNEYNTLANLTGTDLNISDNGGTLTVDLSSLDDSAAAAAAQSSADNAQAAANQALSDASVAQMSADNAQTSADQAQSDINNHIANDGDTDASNEFNTSVQLNGNNLEVTDGGGTLSVDLSGLGGDNLGDHTATQNIQLNGNYLSNDGDSEGINVNNEGNVGINVAADSFTPLSLGSNGPDWMLFKNSGGTNKWDISNNNGQDFVLSEFGVSDRLSVKAGGRIGMGTLEPQASLHLFGEGDFGVGTRIVFGDDYFDNFNSVINYVGEFGWNTLTDSDQLDVHGGEGIHLSVGRRLAGGLNPYETAMYISGNANNRNVGIGTTNPQAKLDVTEDIRVNGVTVGKGNGSVNSENTAIGVNALENNDSGEFNTATGYEAMKANTIGRENTANGHNALWMNTEGSQNTALGMGALRQNRTASSNTGVGYTALGEVTIGGNNTAVGSAAMVDMFEGVDNVAVGAGSLIGLNNGSRNTAIGSLTGHLNQGDANVFIGHRAGYFETGDNKLYIDNSDTPDPLIYGDFDAEQLKINGALQVRNALTVGGFDPNESAQFMEGWDIYTNQNRLSISESGVQERITIIDGGNVGFSTFNPQATVDINGNLKLADGSQGSGKVLTSDADGFASWQTPVDNVDDGDWVQNGTDQYSGLSGNVGIGTSTPQAKLDVSEDILVHGVTVGRGSNPAFDNTAVGVDALASNTGGEHNTAFGYRTLNENTIGVHNTAVGIEALRFNVDGSYNTALGREVLRNSVSGSNNTAVGNFSQFYNIDGHSNTSIGTDALLGVVSGNNNVAIGLGAGRDYDGSSNTYLGTNADATSAGLNNATAIGADAKVELDNSLVLGNGVNVGIGTGAPTEKLHVAGGTIRIENITENTSACRALYVDNNGVVFYKDECSQSAPDENSSDLLEDIAVRDLRIAELEDKLALLESKVDKILNGETSSKSSTLNDETPWIEQNSPNPFYNDTRINYFIPAYAGQAQIVFYDISGRLIQSVDIAEKGRGELTIKGGTLSPGSYIYKLIVDGKEIDVKKSVFIR